MSHYLLTATDKAGAMDRRIACRDEHIAYIDKLRDQDKALLGAAQLDDDGKMSGSVIFFDMTKEELDDYMKEEPYITNKVWGDIKITECKIGPSFKNN
ncbi:MAG: hypothetical protein HOA17_04200 [Candidatus Melainabacteria bacterium]|jgi:hypothetical protein|nr:hypothetical protein [Candidatus Melainabacteria bacterium]